MIFLPFIIGFLSSSSTFTQAVVIDSAALAAMSGPYLLGLGSYKTFRFHALTSYLQHKPRRTKVYHVVPVKHPDGRITTAVHADISKPFHYDYINSPLPHPPLKPKHLKSPVERYAGLATSSSSAYSSIASLPKYKYSHLIHSTHLQTTKLLPPVVSPPYLPLTLLYSEHHKFSSPYW